MGLCSLHLREFMFVFSEVVNCQKLLVLEWDFVPTYSSLGFLSVLNLHRPRACYHILCEVICTLALLGLLDIDSLEPFITFGSYDLSVSTFPSIPESWEKSFDKDWMLHWMLSMSTHCRILGPYVNCYLPQEASLNVGWAIQW